MKWFNWPWFKPELIHEYYRPEYIEISAVEMSQRLLAAMNLYHPGTAWDVQWAPMDGRYRCTSRGDFAVLVEADWGSKKAYLTDFYDCDNFAFAFKAYIDSYGINSVGIAIDYSSHAPGDDTPTPHAYNIVLFDDGTVMPFEPNGDYFGNLGYGLYTLTNGVILI